MPKPYSDSERVYIIKRLKEEAELCLNQFGVKKTTVDELVKRVSIPKGTFYLFYPSKEQLFFDVFLDKHNAIQQTLLEKLNREGKGLNASSFATLIFNLYMEIEDSFLFKLMTSGELELIMRKLPEEVVLEHQQQDDFSFETLFKFIPAAENKNAEVFSSAFRGIFLVMSHKREMGETVFNQAIKVLIEGLSYALFKEEKND